MKQRICPNCGNSSPDAAAGCPCGFLWNEGIEVPAPDIVRARGGQRSVVQQMDRRGPVPREDASPPAPDGVQTDEVAAMLEDRGEEPESQEHPLLSSSSPRRRATAPASFGSNLTSEPRQASETDDSGAINIHDEASEALDQVFLGMGEKNMVVTDNSMVNRTSPREPTGSTGGSTRPNTSLLMECPACDARISKRAPRCPKCNTSPYQPCQVCATTILVNSESCGECGDPDPFNAAAITDARA